jgi:hypothetical protein
MLTPVAHPLTWYCYHHQSIPPPPIYHQLIDSSIAHADTGTSCINSCFAHVTCTHHHCQTHICSMLLTTWSILPFLLTALCRKNNGLGTSGCICCHNEKQIGNSEWKCYWFCQLIKRPSNLKSHCIILIILSLVFSVNRTAASIQVTKHQRTSTSPIVLE